MIKSFSIDKNFIGTDKSLNYNNGYYWSDLSNEFLVYGNEDNNLNELLKISAEDFDLEFPKKYQKVFDQCNFKIQDNSQLFKILSEKDKTKQIKDLTQKIISHSNTITNKNLRYFANVLPQRKNIISKIKDFVVDDDKIQNHCESIENETLKSTLLSFKNKNKVEYDNFGTKTGRLSVTNGANILTLKKEFRDIFKSSFEGGKLIYIDFKTLELNLLLNEIDNKKLINQINEQGLDLYSYFSNKLNIERDIIKNIIISIVYGSGTESISKKYNLDLLFTQKICEHFKKVLCLDEIIDKFLNQYKTSGKITNKFGRSIKVDESDGSNGNKLLNYYLQSTGADISLLAFNNFLSSIDIFNIKPIFIIHDCIVLDSSQIHIENILKLKEIRYNDISLKVTTGYFNNN
jgi:hypothetical protein